MKNLHTFILAIALVFSTAQLAESQNLKKNPPSKSSGTVSKEQLKIHPPKNWKVPVAENPFGVGEIQFKGNQKLNFSPGQMPEVKVFRGENGLPILFTGQTAASKTEFPGAVKNSVRALNYLVSLQPEKIQNVAEEFVPTVAETDEQGREHVRFQQIYKGVPVFGGEMIAHSENQVFEMLNGRYFPTPKIEDVSAKISAQNGFEKALATFPTEAVKTNWTAKDLSIVGGSRFVSELVIFYKNENLENEKLAWHLTVRPNLLRRVEFFVDAKTGEIIEQFDNTCEIDGGRVHEHFCGKETETEINGDNKINIENENFVGVHTEMMPPPVTGTGQDLFNVNQSFGAWKEGTVYYMEDASKTSMFNATASVMPNEPVGAIVTLDAFNTTPEKQASFNYDIVVSNSTTFSNKAGVSGHINSIKSFDYYKTTFNRNSINGSGGNILSFVNVADSDGSSMGNAFWNGDAMWYGNGDSFFKELARGLDVGGHEITHGVVEKTANLVYQNESGALNESFADIFGALIERDADWWRLGEEVMKSGVSAGGTLRNLQDPHNGESSGSPFWQPNHVNEKYNGTQDNGGVHINSGIVNRAFYLFATNTALGSTNEARLLKAEQVYYKALKDYLVKSSKFIDCRIAVIKAATDLFGATVATAAGTAFDQVGIVGSGGGGNTNYQGNLATNPGDDLILITTPDYANLDLAAGNGTVLGTIYDKGVASRPSVTDNGSVLVFVNEEGHIIGMDLVYKPNGDIEFTDTQISDLPEWRNCAISKDGRFLAAITKTLEPTITVYDLTSPSFDNQTYDLYNPTYTQGQITLDVQYADVLEFDYSGKYLMYDAYTENVNSQNETIGYWDINFLKFWENGYTDGVDDITKLFNGLPEKTSVGNPAFSKNSPYIIAFDVIDGLNNQYNIFGANLETGDNSPIVQNNGDTGVPNFNRLDNTIIYESAAKNIRKQGVATSKIAGSGSSTAFIPNHVWGVWFSNGTRSLIVDADEPTSETAQFTVFPNPFSENLTVNISSKKSAPAKIAVFNLFGQQVFGKNLDLQEGKNQLELPMNNLPTGSYLVQFQSENKTSAVKVVKN